MLTADSNWQPGDPLWVQGPGTPLEGCEYLRGGHSNYLFNMRDDHPEDFGWPDAARWPDPFAGRRLSEDGDEIGDLIRLVRMDRVNEREEGAA